MQLDTVEHTVQMAVIAPKESVDAFTGEKLKAHLNGMLDKGIHHLVIDLSQVPFLDSAGLAVLVTALKRARQVGGDVRLVWPEAESARRIIHLTKFHQIFSISDTAADALNSF